MNAHTEPSYPSRADAWYVVILLTIAYAMLIGPTAVGLLNDRVFPGPEGVRYSLTMVALVVALALTLYFATGRRAYAASVRELEDAQALQAQRGVTA